MDLDYRADTRRSDESQDLPETLNHTVMATARDAGERRTSKHVAVEAYTEGGKKSGIPARQTPIVLLTTRDLGDKSMTVLKR